MQIRLTNYEGNYWTIVCGDKFHDMLGADEALWVVAQLMMGRDTRYRLETLKEAMARGSRHYSGDISIERMRKVIESLREDRRLAQIGPLED